MIFANRSATPAGLSTTETLACLLAVAGGVWLGATYTGLNLQGAAYQALDQSDLLTQIPEDWRPTDPACPDGDCPDPATIRAERRVALSAVLDEIRSEVRLLTDGDSALQTASPDGVALSALEQATRDQTQVYWRSLAQVVLDVTTIQHRVAPFLETDEQSAALAVRRRALDYGADAIALLDADRVDEQAVATGARIGEWFAQTGTTLETALDLRSTQPVAGRAASAGEVWASAEAELQKRTELVRRKSLETSAYLSAKYQVDFAPLGL